MPESRRLSALRSAAESEEWDRTVGLLEAHWPRLVHGHQAELLEILGLIPESVLDERPRWIRARDFVRSRSAAGAPVLDDAHGITALTSRIVELRRAGRASEALPLIEEGRTLLSSAPPETIAHAGAEKSEWLYQWARALEDAGATSDAIETYETAARAAAPERMRSLAGGAAALLASLHGERALVERLLEEYCTADPEPLDGGISAQLTRASLRCDIGDREGARRLLATIDPATTGHRWAHYFRIRALAEWEKRPRTLAGDLEAQVRRHDLDTMTALEAGSVRMARHLLLTGEGHLDRALDALGTPTSIDSVLDQLTTALRAHALVRAGRPAEAREVLAALRRERLPPRAELLSLVCAPERSRHDLERITELTAEHGLHWLVTALPDHDRLTVSDMLTHRDPETAPPRRLDPTPALAASPLTAREREVARRAALGETTTAIASALHVSPNTVKTQLRSIYRKLGVTTRSELFTALH